MVPLDMQRSAVLSSKLNLQQSPITLGTLPPVSFWALNHFANQSNGCEKFPLSLLRDIPNIRDEKIRRFILLAGVVWETPTELPSTFE
jgi:hypothetical protein